jgi:hypothetical protein
VGGGGPAIAPAPGRAGAPTPKSEMPADELFEKLKPFKELVEEDIKNGET